jgi:hypothetical protein
MSRAGQLRINREQVDAPGTGNHGLSAAAGTGARPDQIVGPVPVDRAQVARLTLAESLVAGVRLSSYIRRYVLTGDHPLLLAA